jgi:hypothetical protein
MVLERRDVYGIGRVVEVSGDSPEDTISYDARSVVEGALDL